MTRIALGVEYDGAGFLGWERQREGRTVQETLEEALAVIAGGPVRTICAGRTDTAVHALDQVVHLDCAAERPDSAWLRGVNARLPGDVAVRWVARPGDAFHARFSATRRHYRYLIHNVPERSALLRGRYAWYFRPLDVEAMAHAAAVLEGEHDFSSFRGSGCQARHPRRRLHWIRLARHGDVVTLDVCANAFLKHMVRNIVGSLLEVGWGRREPSWVGRVLAARDRRVAGPTALPQGLYLARIEYPRHFGLPEVPAPPVLW
ncbi:MAG: tRNA pseudouridine(38-40) synthase TruA [Ectothiorhodospiraceae bacterium]|nr:tRNA pseudouridine(38-40) synthase TruA [Chromatiales bacterium]MCP5156832.1 tRNA pseudouridine(38-40) synthase TruA [Ectothiorhodospiraceae bacterium]